VSLKQLPGSLKDFWLLMLYPEHLRAPEIMVNTVAGDFEAGIRPDVLFHPGALLVGSPVTPDNGSTEGVSLVINWKTAG